MDAWDDKIHVSERSWNGSTRAWDKWAEGSRLSTRPWDVRRALVVGCVQRGRSATSDRRVRTDPRVTRADGTFWLLRGLRGEASERQGKAWTEGLDSGQLFVSSVDVAT